MSTEMNVFVFIWFKLEEQKCIVTLLQLLILHNYTENGKRSVFQLEMEYP